MINENEDTRKEIPLDDDRVTAALTKLLRNAPPDLEVGRPLGAVFDRDEQTMTIVTDLAYFYIHPAHAERVVKIGDGSLVEWTSWYGGGIQTGRKLYRLDDSGKIIGR